MSAKTKRRIFMWSKKEIVIFFAGVEAFHTLSHIMLSYFHVLPIQFFSLTWTSQLNIVAIITNAIITAALLWWSTKL